MPSIASYPDRNAAQEAFNLLELNGIPPYLKNAGTWSDPERTELVVILPEQVEDAIKLLNNPDHEVVNRVDMELFYEAEQSGDGLKMIGTYVIYAFIAVVALVAFLCVLVANKII